MPKLKNYGPGKRVSLWLPERYLDTFLAIENKSKFLQMALEQAVPIMQWAIMKKHQGIKEEPDANRLPEMTEQFNKKFPINDLTKARQNVRALRDNPSPSPQPNSELW